MKTIRVKELTSMGEKARGLIGRPPGPVMFRTRLGIHTFGLTYPIDVLILDKNSRVVKLKQELKPNMLYFWNPLYNTVLELPLGTIKNMDIRVYDMIKIVTLD